MSAGVTVLVILLVATKYMTKNQLKGVHCDSLVHHIGEGMAMAAVA